LRSAIGGQRHLTSLFPLSTRDARKARAPSRAPSLSARIRRRSTGWCVEGCSSVSYTLPHVREVRTRGEVQTLAVKGEIDPGTVDALQRRTSDALDAGYRRIAIDLSAVTLVLGVQTSLMLGGALRRLTSRTATLAIVAGPPAVRRVLELCAIDGIAFYPDLDAAMSALTPHPAERQEVVRVTSVERHLNQLVATNNSKASAIAGASRGQTAEPHRLSSPKELSHAQHRRGEHQHHRSEGAQLPAEHLENRSQSSEARLAD
jgi:anti-anti-sigma regulatory factor